MLETKPLIRIQHEYRELLRGYEDDIRRKDISDFKLKALFQEVQIFWFKNKAYIEYFLNNLELTDNVAFLAGAVYVDIPNNGHYEFSLLGKRRIINDPLSKMNVFFKKEGIPINYNRIKNYIYSVTIDLLEILDCYGSDFWIVPLDGIDDKSINLHMDAISYLAESCLLGVLKNQYQTVDSLIKSNDTFEDIEKHIDINALDAFVYTSASDRELSLRQRIEKYCLQEMDYETLKNKKNESQIFVMVSMQNIMQCLDIFIIAAKCNIIPYIRNDVVFCYLAVFLNVIEKIINEEILNRCIIAYVARSRYNFKKIPYKEFVNTIGNDILIDKVLSELKAKNKMFPISTLTDIAKILDNYYVD